MARNRLAGVGNQQYADQSAPAPTYPPGNGVIAPQRGGNPYAQAPSQPAYGANQYAQQQQQQPYGGNPYAQQQQPQAYGGNQYAQQAAPGQYGQQDAYAMGGVGNGAGAGAGDFWSELSATNAALSELQERIQAVRQAHQQSLNATDTNAAAYADQLNNEAKTSREQVKEQIKKLFKMTRGDKAAKAQADAVKQRFQSLLNEHQQVEKEFRKKVRDRAERQFKIVKPDATPEEIRMVTESDNPQVFSQALMSSNRYGSARTAYREVQERHAEIQKIEKTLTELAQMFSEMAMLVEQQDETIVQVEQTTAGVNQDVEQGNVKLEQAVVSARKARRKKWICFWIVVAIIAILALVLGLYFGLHKN
ncbi:hypothetical protein Q5752_005563 [Cryptotrichosporon argae]